MAQVIDFYQAVHQIQRPVGWAWNIYDIHFLDPADRQVVWNLEAPSEEAAKEKLWSIYGEKCRVIKIRVTGYAKAKG